MITRPLSQSKSITPLIATFFFAAVICLNFPAVIYQTNFEFIDSPLGYIALILVPLCLLLTAILWLPSLGLKEKGKRIYATTLASLGIAAWVIGNFLNAERGLLNGEQLLRSDTLSYQRLELVSVVLGLVALILLALKFSNVFRALISILLLMSLGTCGYAIVTDKKSYAIASEDSSFYRVSLKKNVFIFLFDAFLSDLFEDILKKQPELANEFDGFTYFSKAAGVAPTTYLSLPAIHSGIGYNEKLSLKDYYVIAIQNGSFLTKLVDKGYDAAGVNFIGSTPKALTGYHSKQMGEGFWRSAAKDAFYLFDISLYRSSPSFLKDAIYNRGEWFTTNIFFETSRSIESNRFLEMIGEKFHPASQKPSVRWIHLFNTHPPASVGADCNRMYHLRWTKENAENQAVCAVRHFVNVLKDFKKNGIYDNSVIFLIADHGIGFSINSRPRILGSAHPVFLVKPEEKRGKLQISESNVYLTDLGKTVCTLTGDCDVPVGVSVFNTAQTDHRSITFYDYKWRHQYWAYKHIPITNRYSIVGPVDQLLSWYKKIPAGRIHALHLDFTDADEPDAFGLGWTAVQKGKKGQSRSVMGHAAQLYLPLKPGVDAMLDTQVWTRPSNDQQYVTLYVNNEQIAKKFLPPGKNTILSFQIPGKSISDPVTRLTFEFTQTFQFSRPDLPGRDEVRALAASFYQLDVRYDDRKSIVNQSSLCENYREKFKHVHHWLY